MFTNFTSSIILLKLLVNILLIDLLLNILYFVSSFQNRPNKWMKISSLDEMKILRLWFCKLVFRGAKCMVAIDYISSYHLTSSLYILQYWESLTVHFEFIIKIDVPDAYWINIFCKILFKNMNFTYEFTLKERLKVKMENFRGTKNWRKILEGLKRKISIFIGTKNIFNPFFIFVLLIICNLSMILIHSRSQVKIIIRSEYIKIWLKCLL